MAGVLIHIACSYHGRKTEHRFENEVVVGRREDPGDSAVGLDLAPDRAVSRGGHARIWAENENCWIKDLGSRGGTIVGSQPIRGLDRYELLPGVPVQIG